MGKILAESVSMQARANLLLTIQLACIKKLEI